MRLRRDPDVVGLTLALAPGVKFFSLPIACLPLAVAVGCSLAIPTPTLQAPGFQYIEHKRIESAMWRLADDVTNLDLLLEHPEDKDAPVDVERVVGLIDDMSEAASTLSSPGQATNHPRLDKELPRFLLDLAAAREAAAATPTRLEPARSLSSACLRCHRSQR